MELHEILTKHDEAFQYQLLSRLQMDCEYYLGYGNRCKKNLWAGEETTHINYMKGIYNNFPADKKPEWLTYEQILTYEKLMLMKDNKIISFEINNQRIMQISQERHDKNITVITGLKNNIDNELTISAGDFVMLINYYQYQKEHGKEIF
jgi:hypothetical protein